MSTIGDRLGRGARPTVGVGQPQAPEELPKEEDLFYAQWNAGVNVSESPENAGEAAASNLADVEVDDTDALVRAPGITLDQDVTPRSARYMFQQAAVGFSTELVIIDPPFFGYKSLGAFTFFNGPIANTSQFGWAGANVGGTFIFSNGLDATYTRVSGAGAVTNISVQVVASSFATAFGRVFAGSFMDTITGLQALAIKWNAANGSVSDWTGIGSGAEFLIANNLEADRIVAMVPLGLQSLGILCRKSLWAGYPTGVANRPADFQIRFVGLGCVGRDTAVATSQGIMYLSDGGVCLYDLNSSTIISKEINALLTPLDYSRLDQYVAAFDGPGQRYLLATPFGIFIYEFALPAQDGRSARPAKWLFRSFVSQSLVMFTNQAGGVFWNNVVGPWNLQTKTWAEMAIGDASAPALPYFGKANKVGFQDYGATANFAEAQTPFWISPQASMHVTDNIETHFFEIQYRAFANADITLTTKDTNGELTCSITKTLPSTNGKRRRVLTFVNTMVGQGTELQIAYGTTAICSIERVRRVVMSAGQSINSTI